MRGCLGRPSAAMHRPRQTYRSPDYSPTGPCGWAPRERTRSSVSDGGDTDCSDAGEPTRAGMRPPERNLPRRPGHRRCSRAECSLLLLLTITTVCVGRMGQPFSRGGSSLATRSRFALPTLRPRSVQTAFLLVPGPGRRGYPDSAGPTKEPAMSTTPTTTNNRPHTPATGWSPRCWSRWASRSTASSRTSMSQSHRSHDLAEARVTVDTSGIVPHSA